jgi:hypothetical protein
MRERETIIGRSACQLHQHALYTFDALWYHDLMQHYNNFIVQRHAKHPFSVKGNGDIF